MFSEVYSISAFLIIQILIFGYILRKIYRAALTIRTPEEYLYAHSPDKDGLSKKTIWKTASASNFQAVNVFFINAVMGYFFGLTMLWLPITFSFGIFLLYVALKKNVTAAGSGLFASNKLPYDRLFHSDNTYAIWIISVVVYGAMIIGAVIEIWFGSSISWDIAHPLFNSPPVSNEAGPELIEAYLGIALAVILFLYVYLGGYKAVAETDSIQLGLIVSMLIIFVLSTVSWVYHESNSFNFGLFKYGRSGQFPNSFEFWSIIIGAFFLNAFWQFVNPQQWQRAKASVSESEYLKSLPMTAKATFLTWIIPIVIGASVSALVPSDSNQDIIAAAQPFLSLYSLGEIYPAYSVIFTILVPLLIGLVIAGIFAAALSSGDTAIIAALARVVSIHSLNHSLIEIRRRAISAILIVWAIVVIFYLYEPNIKNLIFVVSTAQIMFAPIFIAFIISRGNFVISGEKSHLITAFLFLGVFVVALLFNFVDYFMTTFPKWNFIIPALAFAIGVILVLVNVGLKRKHE